MDRFYLQLLFIHSYDVEMYKQNILIHSHSHNHFCVDDALEWREEKNQMSAKLSIKCKKEWMNEYETEIIGKCRKITFFSVNLFLIFNQYARKNS